MTGSAPDLAFCAMLGQCRRRNYLCVQSAALVEWFADDLDASLSGELVQFAALLDTDIGRQAQATSIASQPDATDDVIDVITTGEAVELRMYRLIRENTMQSCFPNVEILLRTDFTGEHSFSKLRRTKNAQRTTIGLGRLNMLTLMSIESKLLRTIDVNSIIDDFARVKARKHNM